MARDRKLSLVYVDPLGLVVKGSTWYLVARSDKEPRTFRISRITFAKLLNEPTQRPAHFNLEKYWKESTRQFQKQWTGYEVTLRLNEETAEELKKWIDVSAVSPGKPQREERALARVVFDDNRHAQFVVQGLGASVEVVSPLDLRERVLANAAAVLLEKKDSTQRRRIARSSSMA